MKNIFFAMLIIVLFVTYGLPQKVRALSTVENFSMNRIVDPKARFDRTEGLIDLAQPNAVKEFGEQNAERLQRGEFGPGDQPVFVMHGNHEFARVGDILVLQLIPLVDSRTPVCISGQILKPGNSTGTYDGTERIGYFNAETAPNGCIQGFKKNVPIKVYTRMFNPEDSFGEFQISISSWDSRGILMQQIWTSVYLINAGQWNRRVFIDNASLSPSGGMDLTGKFPIGLPMFYAFGIPGHALGTSSSDPQYAARSSDGRTAHLQGSFGFDRTTAIDIMMWSPYTRQAIIKPNALVQGLIQP